MAGNNEMNSPPEVSVVMAVYNGAEHLTETINSVLSQADVDLEFIIVNDGSTDETLPRLREHAERDPRIRILDKENAGLTQALIAGCEYARGNYIARQDVGDVSLPKRLAYQTSALDQNKNLAFVSCWTEFCGPNWEHLYSLKGNGLATEPLSILSPNQKHGVVDGPTHHSSVMFSRHHYLACGGYRQNFYYGQDWDLWYRLAATGLFQMVCDLLVKVRVFPNSISMNRKKTQEEFARLSLEAMRLRTSGKSDAAVMEQAESLRGRLPTGLSVTNEGFYFIGESLRRNGDERCLSYLRAAAASPLSWKPRLRILQARLSGLKATTP